MTVLVQPPNGLAALKQTYGDFSYTELAKGWVQVESSWEMKNLVTLRNVGGTGLNIRLHRLVTPVFEQGLVSALKACPNYKVRLLGGFAARHKMNDPTRILSIHSWGAAFDVNWDTNGVGKNASSDLPPEFIKAFTDLGWVWGGTWKSPPDPMHFQFATGV